MNQLVDNLFWSFAGQFPCSRKDSPDSPSPRMSDSLAPRAAVTAQTPFTQRWISSISLISIKGHTEEQDKSRGWLHCCIPLSKWSPTARLLLRLEPQYSQLTHIHLRYLVGSLESTQHFTIPLHQNPLHCEKLSCLRSCEGFRCITPPRFFPQQPLLCQITTFIPPAYHPFSWNHCNTVLTVTTSLQPWLTIAASPLADWWCQH